ncbi:hypothetical protein BSU04nite_02590 [Bacillus spizizenii]|nr:hypothetical protein BSU04nite_02590 [Bacillus spizizenii]
MAGADPYSETWCKSKTKYRSPKKSLKTAYQFIIALKLPEEYDNVCLNYEGTVHKTVLFTHKRRKRE